MSDLPASRNAPTQFGCPVCHGKPIEQVKWISMCDKHREEANATHRRLMGLDLERTNQSE